jgi:hypothetical protein
MTMLLADMCTLCGAMVRVDATEVHRKFHVALEEIAVRVVMLTGEGSDE